MKADFHWFTDQEKESLVKHVLTVTSDSKSRVTVLACVNAAGYAIPNLVIYARANLTKLLYQGEIPGTMYALSPGSGWMDGVTFYEWFEHHFWSMLHLEDPYCSY